MKTAFVQPGLPGVWSVVSDNDSHQYIIPAGWREEFEAWVEYMENGDEPYTGPDFSEYRLNSAVYHYTFHGSWTQ